MKQKVMNTHETIETITKNLQSITIKKYILQLEQII